MIITNFKNWKTINHMELKKCALCGTNNYECEVYYDNELIDKCCYNCYHKKYRNKELQNQMTLF